LSEDEQFYVADPDSRREIMERHDIEAYDDIRICRLNRIKIKNPKDWDQAKYDDFVENDHIMSFKKK